jgi:hypothetical protein
MTGIGDGGTLLLAPKATSWIDSLKAPSYWSHHQLLEDPFGGLIILGGHAGTSGNQQTVDQSPSYKCLEHGKFFSYFS